MQRRFSFWIALVCTLGLGFQAYALPFLSPKVTTEYDHSAPLAGRTYSWGGLHMDVPEYEPAVHAATDKYLQARGWQLAPSGGSATIFVMGNVRGEPQLEKSYIEQGQGWGAGQWSPQGLGRGWAPTYGQATITALSTPESHLVFDIFDTSSHKLLFRGITVEDLSGTEKSNTKRIAQSIKLIFKKFPPRK